MKKVYGVARVESVDLRSREAPDLAPVTRLGSLRGLNLNDTSVSDLTTRSRMGSLSWLELSGTPVSDPRDLRPYIPALRIESGKLDTAV